MRTYKQRLKKHGELKSAMSQQRDSLALSAYDRIKLLCEVFGDAEFRADLNLIDDGQAADWLDKECGDLGHPFLTLKAAYERHPQRESWRNATVYELSIDALAAEEEADREASPPQRSVNRVTKAQYDEMAERAKHHEYRADQLSRDVAALREENAELRRDIAVAQGRIQELERMLKLEPAGV